MKVFNLQILCIIVVITVSFQQDTFLAKSDTLGPLFDSESVQLLEGFFEGAELNNFEDFFVCAKNMPDEYNLINEAIYDFRVGKVYEGIEKSAEAATQGFNIIRNCYNVSYKGLVQNFLYLKKIATHFSTYYSGIETNITNNMLSIIGKFYSLKTLFQNKDYHGAGKALGQIFELTFYVNLPEMGMLTKVDYIDFNRIVKCLKNIISYLEVIREEIFSGKSEKEIIESLKVIVMEAVKTTKHCFFDSKALSNILN